MKPNYLTRLATTVAIFAIVCMSSVALADGTEILGETPVADGTDLIGGGTGLLAEPGLISFAVPGGATVEQVLLYWNGFHSMMGNGDDEIVLDAGGGAIPVMGTLIGGPTLFFTTQGAGDHWSSTYRADITGLGLVAVGNNMITVTGGDFDQVTNGASIIVVIDEGGVQKNISVFDGQDLAFINFAPPLDTTVPQVYNFAPSAFPRVADITLLAGSVQGPASGADPIRPNLVRITIGANPPIDIVDPFASISGPEWDHVTAAVNIPPGESSLTIQALSVNDATNNLPASFAFMFSALAIPEPACGDGNLDPGETCEPPGDPAGAIGNECRDDCTVCGDGVLDDQEECDDGNADNFDGCRNDCLLPYCGDGILDPGEFCEPPGDPAGANDNECRDDCTVCGDGQLNGDEECDDGNSDDNDGCRNDCTVPVCGDGLLDPDESCEPPGEPAGGNGNDCRDDCTVCGDAIVDPGEDCDDGNGVDDDGCRNDCTIPYCGDEILDEGETCDPPDSKQPPNGNACRDDCTYCGDGNVDDGEECDDGNDNNDDGCSNTCELPICGDGVVNEGETCDPPGDPAGGNGNDCRDDCTVCGDGIVDDGEECDDGNGVNDDGCRNDCSLPECGDGDHRRGRDLRSARRSPGRQQR